jgi:hypothetical protein
MGPSNLGLVRFVLVPAPKALLLGPSSKTFSPFEDKLVQSDLGDSLRGGEFNTVDPSLFTTELKSAKTLDDMLEVSALLKFP